MPDSRPRNWSLKTRIGKNEFARGSELQRDRSRDQVIASIQPVQIDVQCHAAVFDDHFLKRPGQRVGSVLFGLRGVISEKQN